VHLVAGRGFDRGCPLRALRVDARRIARRGLLPPLGEELWIVYGQGQLAFYDPGTTRVPATVSTDPFALHLAHNATHRELYLDAEGRTATQRIRSRTTWPCVSYDSGATMTYGVLAVRGRRVMFNGSRGWPEPNVAKSTFTAPNQRAESATWPRRQPAGRRSRDDRSRSRRSITPATLVTPVLCHDPVACLRAPSTCRRWGSAAWQPTGPSKPACHTSDVLTI
jgi:hypothetical protein